MDCSRALAAVFQVDLATARALVPPTYQLITSKDSAGVEVAQATFTAIACETFAWEGVNYPTDMLMITLDITGPAEGEPNPGIAYAYLLLEQVTSPAFHARVAGSGERAMLVKSIDLGGPTATSRQGTVLEANGAVVTWQELGVEVVSPFPVPLNAVQYWGTGSSANSARVGGGIDCVEYVDGVGELLGGLMHPFIITATPDSELAELGLGSLDASGNRVLIGAGFDASVTCTGSLYRMRKHE